MASGMGGTHGWRNFVKNSMLGGGNTASTKAPSAMVKMRGPPSDEDRVEVDAGAAGRAEAVVDPSRDSNRTDTINFEAVVAPRLAGDRRHLRLGKLG